MENKVVSNGPISVIKLEDKFKHPAEQLCYDLLCNQVNLGVTDLEALRDYIINVMKHVSPKHGNISISDIHFSKFTQDLLEKDTNSFAVFSGKKKANMIIVQKLIID